MPRIFERYLLPHLIWPLFGLVILLMALTLRQSLLQIEHLYQTSTLNSAIDVREELKKIEIFLDAILGQAEERLLSDPRSELTNKLYRHIEEGPLGLTLDNRPTDLPDGLAGNLTGKGPLPPPGSEREDRIHLALSLSPLLATASQHLGKEIAWAYFTGVDNFIYLYPWHPSSQFRFSAAVYTGLFWQDTLSHPSSAKTKAITLSRPYEDVAGLGTMVSLSLPLYKGETLIGIISIDILLSQLQKQMQRLAPEQGEYILLNQFNDVLAHSHPETKMVYEISPSGGYDWHNWGLQLTQPITNTPLKLIHRIELLTLIRAIFCQSSPTLLAILCMLVAALSNLRSLKLNQQLNYVSCHDALTGALNRHHLNDLEQQKGVFEQLRPTVLMCDADHFKQVNDNFGHDVGDTVLVQLVQICQQQLRKTDRLVRWGGEEFLLLIGDGKEPQIADIAERLRLSVANYDWNSIAPGLAVTISLGYHPYQEGLSLQEMINRADGALYQAKTKGRNRSERWLGDAS